MVNWKTEGSVDSQTVAHNPAVDASFLRHAKSVDWRKRNNSADLKKLRASIAICVDAHPPRTDIQMRQRSLTVSGDGCTGQRLDDVSSTDVQLDAEEEQQPTSPDAPTDRRNSHWNAFISESSAPPRCPVDAYPSLDFFDTGLEDYSRRAASFSRFIQSRGHVASVPFPSTHPAGGSRRRRTCSFSKVLSRNNTNKSNGSSVAGVGEGAGPGGGSSGVLSTGSVKHHYHPPKNTSSLPSVRHIPSLVTAV